MSTLLAGVVLAALALGRARRAWAGLGGSALAIAAATAAVFLGPRLVALAEEISGSALLLVLALYFSIGGIAFAHERWVAGAAAREERRKQMAGAQMRMRKPLPAAAAAPLASVSVSRSVRPTLASTARSTP